jgi:hypothetical protein
MKERYWLTPPDVYKKLDDEFHFDYDPCPHPRPEGYDGLEVEWGRSNYVNPPFKRTIEWVKKCVREAEQGKQVVYVAPVPTWLNRLIVAGAELRALGRIRWVSIESGDQQPKGNYNICAFILSP